MSGDLMVWMAAGYALFLIAVAYGLDFMARGVAARSASWRSRAFRYHADRDGWRCPRDEWLWPQAFDSVNRVVRYRARPTVCNACPVKPACTSSDRGREVTRDVDPWPHSEAGRFHRGIACTVALLAVAIPGATMVAGGHGERELEVLGATIVVVVLAGLPLASHLRGSPTGFPDHVPIETSVPAPLTIGRRPGMRTAPSLDPGASTAEGDRFTIG